MKVYVSSSWRNPYQHGVVDALRLDGHEVYDFRNPAPGNKGFHWSEIDAEWQAWTPDQFRAALLHPIAEAGFKTDFEAMQWAEAFVLVLPCGRSAHLELGWAAGAGKLTIVYCPVQQEPELMTKLAEHFCVSLREVSTVLAMEEFPFHRATLDSAVRAMKPTLDRLAKEGA